MLIRSFPFLLIFTLLVFVNTNVISATITSKNYLIDKEIIKYSDGSSKVYVAKKATHTWSADHLTKTTTYTFADKTTNVVVSAPQLPTITIGVNATGVQKTVVATYGDGYVLTTSYKDGTQTVTDNKTGTKPKTSTVTGTYKWSADHLTKTTTYTFADKTTNAVVSAPQLPTITNGVNATEVQKTVVATYGDGYVLTTSYKDGTQTITDNKTGTKPKTSTVTGTHKWSADHLTKTTTYTFADKTTNTVASVVQPTAGGVNLTAANYPSNWTAGGVLVSPPSVSAKTMTYGDGTVIRSEDGTQLKPFSQINLMGKGITDPNAVIKTDSNSIYDFRWGAPDKSGPIIEAQSNVSATVKFNTLSMSLRSYYRGQLPTVSVPLNYTNTAPLGLSSAGIQGVWITNDVKNAWAKGWTGANVKIGIMDDFTVNNASDIQQTILPNGCSRSTSLYICSTDSRIIFRMTHGDQVSLIAGGSSNKLIGAIAETGLYAQSNGDAGSYVGAASFTVSISSPIYGVAKGARVYRNDFLSYQSSTEGLFSVLKSWEEGVDSTSNLYKSLKVMNLSLGSFKTNASQNAIIYSNYLKVANSINVNSDMVYVKAAGNSSCFISQQNCDPINAVLYGSKKFGSKVIIVGALDQAGGLIASYSNFAGAYSDRFVVEDGRGIIGMNGRYEQGTSFSAPRVTGYVAIVSQKFPNLNAEQLSNVILQTARYDTLKCNNSSTGCDKAIYGQGEASLSRALAPVGRLR